MDEERPTTVEELSVRFEVDEVTESGCTDCADTAVDGLAASEECSVVAIGGPADASLGGGDFW